MTKRNGTTVIVGNCPHRERPREALIGCIDWGAEREVWRVETWYPDGCGGYKTVSFRPTRVLHAEGGEIPCRYREQI